LPVDGGAISKPQIPAGGVGAENEYRIGSGELFAEAVSDTLAEREERGPHLGPGVVGGLAAGSERPGSRCTGASRLSAYGLKMIRLADGVPALPGEVVEDLGTVASCLDRLAAVRAELESSTRRW